MQLSAIVITKNESATITRCLTSLAFADEIIVVDDHSTDDTVARARRAGATVYTNAWPGFGAQKNFGAAKAQGEWLLFIDADEEVSVELRQEIQKTLANPMVHFFWLRIVTIFLEKPLTHLFGHNPRLFKKTAGQWTDARVHEQVMTSHGEPIRLGDANSQILHAPLLHHSHPTLRSYFAAMHTYTSLDAAQMQRTGTHRSGRRVPIRWWMPWHMGIRQFAKLLLYRGGWRDGWAGWIWCFVSAYYEWELGQKYLRAVRHATT